MIFLGAPGAGKGTQAEKISGRMNIPHISTGDMFREAVSNQTELGKKAGEYMDRGELVPDEVVVGIVKERLLKPDCKQGCILDGFPRTLPQAEALDEVLDEMGKSVDYVLNIEVSEEEVVKRLTGRRTCRNCGTIYHIEFNKPEREGVCGKCGGELYQRDDDKEETVRNRLRVYGEKTAPLVNYYRRKGVLINIDGEQSVGEVTDEIMRVLENK